MHAINSLKSKAVRAVKVDQRLISDVAMQYGVSRRRLYAWLNEKSAKRFADSSQEQAASISRASLKSQIKTLQTEVKQLKSELKQYLITERLVNGKIILEFNKRNSSNIQLREAS